MRPSTAPIMCAFLVPWRAAKASETSDIDFLVDMEPGRSLLDVGGLQAELEALFGRHVDVVTEGGLYWLLRRRILKEARAL